MAELHDLTALEQGALVRRGEVSPLELTDHYPNAPTDSTRSARSSRSRPTWPGTARPS